MITTIADLPPEVLVKILEYVSFSDIEKHCMNVCKLWETLIASHFLVPKLQVFGLLDVDLKKHLLSNGWNDENGSLEAKSSNPEFILETWKKFEPYRTKILIAGGNATTVIDGKTIVHAELIDLLDPSQSSLLDGFVSGTKGCFGGIINDQIVLVTGKDSKLECSEIRSPKNRCSIFPSYDPMNPEKVNFNGVVVDQSILIMGGDNDKYYLKRFESKVIASNGDCFEIRDGGPNLGFGLSRFGVVRYNENSIYLIGGDWRFPGIGSYDWHTNRTWIANLTLNTVQDGPEMNQGRCDHAYGKMIIGGKVLIVVAGGLCAKGNYKELDSVELLDPLSEQGWIEGPKMPFVLRGASMVTSPCGKGVIVFGGFLPSKHRNPLFRDQLDGLPSSRILEMRGDSIETLEWKVWDHKLRFSRHDHIAIPIPDKKNILEVLEQKKLVVNAKKKKFRPLQLL